MKTFIYSFLAGFLALVGIELKAQSITGNVVDAQSMEPLIGANLYSKSDWKTGTSTGLEGEFTLRLRQVPDTLIVSFIGYSEKEVIINQDDSPLYIELKPSEINMAEVVIKGEKLIAEEFTYKKVNRMDIYTNPSAKADPLLAVNSLPSSTTLDESANISFRGSSPAETGIFMNNVPIYDAVRFSQLNGIGTFSIFNTSIVDEMLVFPGNPPLEYGNTTSGLIAIQTTEAIPEHSTNMATLSLASFGLQTSRPINEKTGINIFSNYQPSAIIRGLNYEAMKDIKKFQANDLGVNIIHKGTKNTVFKIFNYSLYEKYTYHFVAPTFDGSFYQQKMRNFTVTNWRKSFKQHQFTVNSNLSFSQANFSYAETDIDINNNDFFLSTNYQYSADKYDIKTGLTYDFRNQQFDGTFYRFDYAIGEGFPTENNKTNQDLHRPEAYLYGKYYVGNWIFGAGLRKNLPVDKQQHYLSSQLNTKFTINERSSVTAALGQYNKYSLSQNESADATLIKSDQLSIDYTYSSQPLSLSISTFRKETQHQNASTTVNGLEFFVKSTLLKNITGQASFTFIDGETTHNESSYPSTYDLDYFVRGNLKYQFNSYWSITGNFLLRDGRYYHPLETAVYDAGMEVYRPSFVPNSQQERQPDYQIIDISISRLIPIKENLNMIAFASVSNITNHKNIRDYTYNFDYSKRKENLFTQRSIYFGAVINF